MTDNNEDKGIGSARDSLYGENAIMPGDAKGRIIVIAVFALILITIWFMLDLAIITFVLTFVFFHLQRVTKKAIKKTPLKIIPDGVILVIIYIIVLGLVVLFSIYFTPVLVGQITDIARSLMRFNFVSFVASIDPDLVIAFGDLDVNEYVSRAGQILMGWIGIVGRFSFHLVMALALSFLILLEKDKIKAIGKTVEKSRIAFVYRYFILFGGNFCITFAKVMKVQVTIAFINCAVSMILLTIMGFPNILALGLMIFILGLIPVAGVIISLIPLAIIAFNVGGLIKVLEVLIMIVVIHAIEAYVLNPKLMSHRTSLPVSLVFLVLLVAENYLGMWGLLIGVPLFIFLLTMLDIDYASVTKPETKLRRRLRVMKWKRQRK